MDRNKDIEQIEKYLNDELSEAEKQALDRRLAEDDSLAEAFRRRQTAHRAVDYLVAKNLKAQLMELEKEDKVVSIGRMRRRRMIIWSAAATVLLVLGFFFFLLPSGQMTGPELVADYYEAPDFSARSADEPTTAQAQLERGKNALENEAFDRAVTTLDSIPASDEYYIPAQYYLGHALYLSGQYEPAQERFARVSASNDLRLQEDAEWYELLSCLVRNGDCRAQLDELTGDPQHPHHRAAVEIQQRLK